MVKKDSLFNGNDDWLAKELEREKRVSAWDFDEKNEVRLQHEENCDARASRVQHLVEHNSGYGNGTGTPQAAAITWMVIDIFAVVILVFVSIFYRLDNFFPAIFLFLCINPGIFISLFLFKRMPSAGYYIMVLTIAVMLEIFTLLINHRIR